jgi:hypothetical protein
MSEESVVKDLFDRQEVQSLEQLLADFQADVQRIRNENRDS